MSHLNFKHIIVASSMLFLISCQSVQSPEGDAKALNIKNNLIAETKVDEGLITVNNAIEHIKNDQPALAEETLKAYLDKNNDNRVKLNLALIYMTMNKVQLAKNLFISIQDSDANNPIVLEHLAIIARQEGQFEQSKRLYIQALKLSDKPSIHLNYAILLDLYLNELKTALLHYEIYQNSTLEKIDTKDLDKWIADLNVRIKRENQ